MRRALRLSAAAALILSLGPGAEAQAPPAGSANMTFFVTSVGVGDGANLGGLAGADAHCQRLAQAAGAGNHTWRAYLSTQGAGAVNARDRIGRGPWQNARGVVIARDVAQLHGENNISKETALNERGQPVNGVADPRPLMHDILTGSQANGTAFAAGEDRTCRNWSYSGPDGFAMLGHHDRTGSPGPAPTSWNASHESRGCSQQGLVSTGGAGLLYCFAAQ